LISTQPQVKATTARRWVIASALWTIFVWFNRGRNVAVDDAMSRGERFGAFAVSFVFLGAAVALLLMVRRRWADELRTLVPVFAIGTVGWWAVRSVLILVHDHGWGFRIVHVVLGIISSVLAVAVWQAVRHERVRS
jgi:hypothetical protein